MTADTHQPTQERNPHLPFEVPQLLEGEKVSPFPGRNARRTKGSEKIQYFYPQDLEEFQYLIQTGTSRASNISCKIKRKMHDLKRTLTPKLVQNPSDHDRLPSNRWRDLTGNNETFLSHFRLI